MSDEIVLSHEKGNVVQKMLVLPEEAPEMAIAGAEHALPQGPAPQEVITIDAKPKRGKGTADERAMALMDRFMYARDARSASGIEDEWWECEQLYNQQDKAAVEGEWRSDAYVPHATREVNNAVPHMVSAVLDSDALVSVTATDPADADYAHLEERIIKNHLEQRNKTATAIEVAAKQAALLGTGVLFTGFRITFEERTFMKEMKVAENLVQMKEVVERVPVDAYNTLVPLDITDIWVAPDSTPLYIPRLYYYERKSIRQMKEGKLPYTNYDKLTENPQTMADFLLANEYSDDDQVAAGSRNRDTVSQDSLDPEDRLHHLIHEWDYSKGTWSVVADGQVELLAPRPWPTPSWPFHFVRYDLAPGNRFYGRGVVFPVAKSCRNANRLRRQRDDNVELCLSKMMVVRMGAVMDEQKEFVWRPGGVIHVRGGQLENAVKVLEMGDVTQSSYADERIIKDDIEAVNGIGNIAAGVPDGKSRTASGTSILRQMAVMRLRGPIRHLMEALQTVCQAFLENNRRFLPTLKKEQMLGVQAKLYKMYEEKFSENQRVTLEVHPANSYDNSEVQNAQLLNAVNILGGLGMLPFLEPKALTKLVLKRIGGVHDTDALFRPEEQTYTASDFFAIVQESQALAEGEQVQPQPTDRHDAHIETHRKYAAMYPQYAAMLDPHIQMHEQLKQMAAAGQAGLLPPGMPGTGPGMGAMNPNRQPSPTSDEDAARSAGNSMVAGNNTVRQGA